MARARPLRAVWPRAAVVLLTLVTLAAREAALAADEWPGLRGPNHDGSAAAGSRFGGTDGAMAVRWRASVGSGYSGIAVGSGRAVTMFSDGPKDVVAAFDIEAGREAWRVTIGEAHKGLDGSYDGPIATPAVAGGRAFALGPRGDLVAVDVASGRLLWRADVVARDGARKPHYGFSSSPIVVGGVLVAEIGGDKGHAVAGFDPPTGRRLWTAGDDAVQYQSPVVVRVGRRDLLIALGDARLYGIDPATGRVVFDHAHGGGADPIGAGSAVPVPAGDGRLFVKTHADKSTMLRLIESAEGVVSVQNLWTAPVLRTTYSPPVYFDGHLYGMNGRATLTCVDAATGEMRWRSREPGDGFPALVGRDLVVLTKERTLHVAPASPQGWNERAWIELFSDIAWTPPSIAAGSVFARSQSQIARVDWKEGTAAATPGASMGPAASPTLSRFLAEVAAATDKAAAVERLLATAPDGPLFEAPDHVVFLYRGDASDVGIVTDLIGARREDPMRRVPGTDLFFYEARLEPAARASYQFVRNFEPPGPDARNPRRVPAFGRGEASSVVTPGWREPDHLREAPGPKGRVEAAEAVSATRPGAKAALHVYLPAGYDAGSARYPVAYVFGGDGAREQGLLPRSLDRLIPGRVAPAVVVFVGRVEWGAQKPPGDDETTPMVDFLVKDVVPFVDGRYRTVAQSSARAVVGAFDSGIFAAHAGFRHPAVFGGIGLQSVFLLDTIEAEIRADVRTAAERPMRVYLDWGRYGHHSTREAWDFRAAHRRFDGFLRERGYRPAGGEAADGVGWASWRNRTDQLFEALFPALTGAKEK